MNSPSLLLLKKDADKEVLWRSCLSSKKSIGAVLMDQSLVAGIGNIYRAEILYKAFHLIASSPHTGMHVQARLHPEQPCRSLTREKFETLWMHSVQCLQRGFESGSIITVDPEDAVRLGEPWTRRYVYNQTTCGNCGSRIQSWADPNKRTVYACTTCQVLATALGGATEVTEARQSALARAKGAQVFHSHCAPDQGAPLLPPRRLPPSPAESTDATCVPSSGGASLVPEKMTVAQLKEALAQRGTPLRGSKRKRDLLELLQLGAAQSPEVRPGTAQLTAASAVAAAKVQPPAPTRTPLPQPPVWQEKKLAAESRAVEHVAEQVAEPSPALTLSLHFLHRTTQVRHC
jgi:hypothetical protein